MTVTPASNSWRELVGSSLHSMLRINIALYTEVVEILRGTNLDDMKIRVPFFVGGNDFYRMPKFKSCAKFWVLFLPEYKQFTGTVDCEKAFKILKSLLPESHHSLRCLKPLLTCSIASVWLANKSTNWSL